MKTTLDLTEAYLFTKKVNIVILCIVFVLVFGSNILPWNVISIGAYILIFGLLLVVVCWPQNIAMRYFTLIEGDFGNCCEFNDPESNSDSLTLSVQKCRITLFGCWLVFTPNGNDKNQHNSWCFFQNHMTVFVPKHLLLPTEYKSLCRHIIWHSQ